jgi:hypothetical protein
MDFELTFGIATAILSIVLTVVAWRNGWGPRALLPIVITTVLGLIVGAVLGESTPTAIAGALIDVVGLAALMLMVRQPPRPATQMYA